MILECTADGRQHILEGHEKCDPPVQVHRNISASAFLHESPANETNWQASHDATAPFEWRLSSSEPKPKPAAECGSPAEDELSYLPIRSSALPAENQNKKYTKRYAKKKKNDRFQRNSNSRSVQMLKTFQTNPFNYSTFIRQVIRGFFARRMGLHPLHDFEGSTNRLAIVRPGHRQGINGTERNVS